MESHLANNTKRRLLIQYFTLVFDNTASHTMKRILLLTIMTISLLCSAFAQKDIYSFTVKDINGNAVSMSDYKGKVILVVNVASHCGLTPQYEGLEALHNKYKERGLVVIAFPCNQFFGQEPGTSEQILSFCTSRYNITFPLMEKIDVNGSKSAPIYQWLRGKAPFKGYPKEHADFAAMLNKIHAESGSGFDTGDNIRWNFCKFLVSRNGKKVTRFEPMVTPAEMEKEIEKALGK